MPSPDSFPDDLLARARTLDPSALEAIHTRYYPEIYRYVRFRLDPEEVCEQVIAAVFAQLLDALRSRRISRAGLQKWLLNTASKLVQEILRHSAARPSDPDDRSNPGQAGGFNAASERHHLRLLLQQLTPEQQHFLAVRFGERRSLEETAQLLGKSLNDAKELQYQAVAAFKHLLVDERA